MAYIGFAIDEKKKERIERKAETKEALADMMFVCDENDDYWIHRYRHVIDHNILHGEETLGGY